MAWRNKHWSYTQWSKYQTCPLQADHQYNQRTKRPDVKHPAMERGIRLHTWGENYLNNNADDIPDELARWLKRMRTLRDNGAVAEEPWAFDRHWNPTSYSYKNEKGWLRMKLDAHVVHDAHMEVIDFKTGGIYNDHADQAHLYATGAFHRFPEVETIDVVFMYWDKARTVKYEYGRERDTEHMTRTWERRYEEMMSEERFLPRPGRHCSRCDFAKKNGGPCAYGR